MKNLKEVSPGVWIDPSMLRQDVGKASSPEDVARLCADLILEKQEQLIALYMDPQGRIVERKQIAKGTGNAIHAGPLEIFHPAFVGMFSRLALVHNHPSGDPAPSEEDLVFTRRMVQAGKILGVEVVNHVIVSSGGFCSFSRERLI